jgi:predicted nucleic-acid-binding protein
MLENSEERVKLLRKGFTQKQIEQLYLEENNFKIVNSHVVIELVEIDERQYKKNWVNCEAVIECALS